MSTKHVLWGIHSWKTHSFLCFCPFVISCGGWYTYKRTTHTTPTDQTNRTWMNVDARKFFSLFICCKVFWVMCCRDVCASNGAETGEDRDEGNIEKVSTLNFSLRAILHLRAHIRSTGDSPSPLYNRSSGTFFFFRVCVSFRYCPFDVRRTTVGKQDSLFGLPLISAAGFKMGKKVNGGYVQTALIRFVPPGAELYFVLFY